MTPDHYDVIIVGTGPAALGAAFHLTDRLPSLSILMIDKETICSGGLLNDCKQNYSYPIGFAEEYWTREEAERLLPLVEDKLQPAFKERKNLETYRRRAERIGAILYDVRQAHVGTDRSKLLIRRLMDELAVRGVRIMLKHEVTDVREGSGGAEITVNGTESFRAGTAILAPGRKGFGFLQQLMERLAIPYIDNIVDVGIRVETRLDNYPIVRDYYDPKFYFPERVRTFCTNSGHARVVLERYEDFSLVNGHALSAEKSGNDLANFALLKTIGLKDPVRSGHQMALFLGRLAHEIGGGRPIMQRVGDFRMGKRSTAETFNDDLYSFRPTCQVTAGDLGLAVPAKIMRHIWAALKKLDTIVPGAGTSRGITGAWASGIRAAEGILKARG